MNRRVKVWAIAFSVLFIFLASCNSSSVSNRPSKKEIEKAFAQEIPDYLSLISYKIENTENVGNKVDPVWISRFVAIVKTKEQLYKQVDSEQMIVRLEDNEFNWVAKLSLITKNEESKEIWGVSTSKPHKNSFSHIFKYDGNPFEEFGKSKKEFGKYSFLIGGEEEKQFYAEIEKDKENFAANLSNATKILPGDWCVFDSDDGKLDYVWRISSDGSYHAINGPLVEPKAWSEWAGKWRVDNDVVHFSITEQTIRGTWGKSGRYVSPKRETIFYIDENKIRFSHKNLNRCSAEQTDTVNDAYAKSPRYNPDSS